MTSPVYTRPATWSDVVDLARRLNRHGVRYVLVGAYALAAHGLTRMTTDIDVAVDPEPENSRRWIAALAELPDGVAAELASETDPFGGDTLHAIRINDEFTIDIMPSVAGISFERLSAHAVPLRFDGEAIPVLDLAGLLMTKQGERPKDQADALLLQEAIRRQSGKSG